MLRQRKNRREATVGDQVNRRDRLPCHLYQRSVRPPPLSVGTSLHAQAQNRAHFDDPIPSIHRFGRARRHRPYDALRGWDESIRR